MSKELIQSRVQAFLDEDEGAPSSLPLLTAAAPTQQPAAQNKN